MKREQIVEKFENGQNAKSGNYESSNGSLYLHGNEIAKIEDNQVFFTLAGWNSLTTKRALNDLNSVHIHTVRGTLMNFDKEIDSNTWYKVSDF
jgi:hypothetical protein